MSNPFEMLGGSSEEEVEEPEPVRTAHTQRLSPLSRAARDAAAWLCRCVGTPALTAPPLFRGAGAVAVSAGSGFQARG